MNGWEKVGQLAKLLSREGEDVSVLEWKGEYYVQINPKEYLEVSDSQMKLINKLHNVTVKKLEKGNGC